jgi:hypothetical protein
MKRNLKCCCCGGPAGRHEQHWNRDTGYGICPSCVAAEIARGTPPEEILRSYGIAGIHYGATIFSWDAFRGTLTGGARELAMACQVREITSTAIFLQINAEDAPLAQVFSRSLHEQIGLGPEFKLFVEIPPRDPDTRTPKHAS